MDNKITDQQIIKLTDRSKLELNGVESVAEFEENYVTLDTVLGRICIDGENLKIIDLSQESGKILINGKVNEISYQDTKSKRKKSFFG